MAQETQSSGLGLKPQARHATHRIDTATYSSRHPVSPSKAKIHAEAPALANEDEHVEQSTRRSALFLVIGIVVIVILFAAMIYLGIRLAKPKPVIQDYSNYTFTQQDNIWWTQVQKGNQPFNLPFFYAPWEVENIQISRSALVPIWQAQLDKSIHFFIAVDPASTGTAVVAAANIGRVIGNKYGLFNMNVSSAFTSYAGFDYPVMTCENSSPKTFVMTVEIGPVNKVASAGKAGTCFVVTATNSSELLRVSDAYTYRLLGIIKTPQ